jgi:hypothetical protein
MAIEIKEMHINTSVDGGQKTLSKSAVSKELLKLKGEIIKECMEKMREHLERQNDK